MYLDKQEEFSDSQVVTTTAISTNQIDLNPNNSPNVLQDIGTGEEMYLVVQVDTTATAGGAATLDISLESDSTADLATSPTVHFRTGAFALASLTAGAQLAAIRLPAGNYERYLGVRYTVATGPLTAGAFSAFLTKDVQAQRTYARGYTVQ